MCSHSSHPSAVISQLYITPSCRNNVTDTATGSEGRVLLTTAQRNRRSGSAASLTPVLPGAGPAASPGLGPFHTRKKGRMLCRAAARSSGHLPRLQVTSSCHERREFTALSSQHKAPYLPFLGPRNRERESFTHISDSRVAFYLGFGNLVVEQQGQAKLK